MDQKKELTRAEMGSAEALRDPIFLLQTKQHFFNHEKADEHNLTVVDDLGFIWPNGKQASMKTLEDLEVAVPYWETDRVFYSREEGEEWAEVRKYNYGKKHIHWRVYSVVAQGELAGMLDRVDAARRAARRVVGDALNQNREGN